jgi:hypothetical protein
MNGSGALPAGGGARHALTMALLGVHRSKAVRAFGVRESTQRGLKWRGEDGDPSSTFLQLETMARWCAAGRLPSRTWVSATGNGDVSPAKAQG